MNYSPQHKMIRSTRDYASFTIASIDRDDIAKMYSFCEAYSGDGLWSYTAHRDRPHNPERFVVEFFTTNPYLAMEVRLRFS